MFSKSLLLDGGAESSARSAGRSEMEARVEQGAEESENDALRPCETIQVPRNEADEVSLSRRQHLITAYGGASPQGEALHASASSASLRR